MGAFTVRDYRAEDAAAILEINAANVPEVGDMDASKLDAFAVGAAWLPVVEVDGEVAAFAVFLTQGADYESPTTGGSANDMRASSTWIGSRSMPRAVASASVRRSTARPSHGHVLAPIRSSARR